MRRIDAVRALLQMLDGEPVLSNLGANTYDLRRRRSSGELLHVGCHGLRFLDRPGAGARAA